jgi:hypothetical protein
MVQLSETCSLTDGLKLYTINFVKLAWQMLRKETALVWMTKILQETGAL